MPKFNVEVEYRGYSRGYETYLVEADSLEKAKQNYWDGVLVDSNEGRNDWDREVCSAWVNEPEVLVEPVAQFTPFGSGETQ